MNDANRTLYSVREAEVKRCEENLDLVAQVMEEQAKGVLAHSMYADALRDASALINEMWLVIEDMKDGDVAPSDGRDLRGSLLP